LLIILWVFGWVACVLPTQRTTIINISGYASPLNQMLNKDFASFPIFPNEIWNLVKNNELAWLVEVGLDPKVLESNGPKTHLKTN
jgi:hypothetical protein